MEFILSTDLSVIPQQINFNAEDLKRELQPKLDYYKSMVVTEDGIKDAKIDRAKLNLLKNAVEDKRKEVKKQCLAPYEEFEKQCKEIVAMIDSPIIAIDTQIKAFDDVRRQEKWADICEYFDSRVGDLEITPERFEILIPKWKNATMKIEDIKQTISDELDRIRSDLHSIDVEFADVPYKAAIVSRYNEQFSLSQARIQAATLHTEHERMMKKQEEEKQRQIERENAKSIAEQAKEINEASRRSIMQENAAPQNAESHDQTQNDPIVQGGFMIQCKKSQLVALKTYIVATGINITGTITTKEFEKIKEERTSCK